MATVMVTVSNPGVIANECTEECGNGDDHLRIINQPVLVKLPNLFWSRTRDTKKLPPLAQWTFAQEASFTSASVFLA